MRDEEEVWPEETAASAPAALVRARRPQLQEDGPWEQPPTDGVSTTQDVQQQWKQPPWMLKVKDLLLGRDKPRYSLL